MGRIPTFLAPVIALAVIAFVIRDRHLAWAMALAVLPTLLGVLTMVAFGVGVAVYGF